MSGCGHFTFAQDHPGLAYLGLGVPALVYASLGYAVLPLDRGGKRPHRMLGREGGVYHASTDPDTITDRWSLDPAANIGVATGSASGGLVVLDLDVKAGAGGPAEFESFREAWGLPFAPGPVAQTPSGGWHAWLRWPWQSQVPERPGILPGVDVKGDGGLVVVAPSMQLITPVTRQGDQRGAEAVPVGYRWVTGCPCTVPWVPEWMPQWLATAPATGQPGGVPHDVDVQQVIEHGAEVGKRNHTLYRLACSLYRKHGTRGQGATWVRDTVHDAWRAGDTTGMPASEVAVICESARRFIEKAMAAEEANWRAHARYLQG